MLVLGINTPINQFCIILCMYTHIYVHWQKSYRNVRKLHLNNEIVCVLLHFYDISIDHESIYCLSQPDSDLRELENSRDGQVMTPVGGRANKTPEVQVMKTSVEGLVKKADPSSRQERRTMISVP